MSSAKSASRPGGRNSRVLSAIYAAVGELVGEGATKITFPIVAERAGVNPTTLYRRWPDVNALLEEVTVGALTGEGESEPDTGAFAADLSTWAAAIADDITRVERARYLRAMVSARLDMVWDCPVMDARREQAERMVDRAHARGEAVPSAQQILDHVIAPLYHHVAFALEVDDGWVRQLVADVLLMVR